MSLIVNHTEFSVREYGVRVHYKDNRPALEEWAGHNRKNDPTGWGYAWNVLKPFHAYYTNVQHVEVIER